MNRGISFIVVLLICGELYGVPWVCGSKLTQVVVGPEAGTERVVMDPAKKREAALEMAGRYQSYFDGVRGELKEREYIIELVELALIAKEHVLLMGPPGNAKSMLSDRILGGIEEDNGDSSYYRIQMTPETTISETHGPLDYKTLTEEGRYVRLYEEGMLLSKNVFIDEIFDARSNAMRNVLGLLNERAHAQGPRRVGGKIETVIGATNKFIGEVYERAGNDDPKALIDRFAFSAFVAGDLERTQSAVDLIRGIKPNGGGNLHFKDLDKARALVSEVEVPESVAKFLAILSRKLKADTESMEAAEGKKYRDKQRNGEEAEQPYRATKYHSPRTLGKAGNILRAIVVRDWIAKGGKRELKATMGDLKELEKFFTMSGPSTKFIEGMIAKATPKERGQLEAVLQERDLFKKHYDETLQEMNQVIYEHAIADIQTELEGSPTAKEKKELAKKIAEKLIEVEVKVDDSGELANLSGEQLGLQYVHDYLKNTLKHLTSDKGETQKWVEDKRKEIGETKRAKLADSAEHQSSRNARTTTAAKPIKDSIRPLFETLANNPKSFRSGIVYPPVDISVAKPESFDFVTLIKPGEKKTFTMGSKDDASGLQPERQVTLTRPLQISATPVTQLQYTLVMGNNPSQANVSKDQILVAGQPVAPNRPVESLTWIQAQGYVKQLSELDPEWDYRLPSEAEWEYAARGGTKTKYHFGDDPARLREFGHHTPSEFGGAHDVSEKKPNAFGLYDVGGNVQEFVEDHWNDLKGNSKVMDPVYIESNNASNAQIQLHVLRGSSFMHGELDSVVYQRSIVQEKEVSLRTGFRVVREKKKAKK